MRDVRQLGANLFVKLEDGLVSIGRENWRGELQEVHLTEEDILLIAKMIEANRGEESK